MTAGVECLGMETLATQGYQPLIALLQHCHVSDRANTLVVNKKLAEIARNPAFYAQWIVQKAQREGSKPVVLDLLLSPATHTWTDDQLYQGVSHLLKAGCDVSIRPRTPKSKSAGGACDASASPPPPITEVAWLTQRVATRTLALLIKQRPACAECIKEFETLKAGVLSNKEYTLLFLTARGADFMPHLERLTEVAIQHGASKALPWLLQWQEVTPDKLRTQFQSGLPDPTITSCADVAATLEVLLLHGLNASCTITCTQGSTQPTAADPGTERSLLEWAVLHAAAAAKQYEVRLASQIVAPPTRTPSPTPPPTATATSQLQAMALNGRVARRSGSVPDLAILSPSPSLAPSPATAASDGGAPPRSPYFGPELLRVVINRGANVNARKGAALLLAAQSLRGDLVSELLTDGADVTLPRLPSGADLLRWAVNKQDCPTESGVLQALLTGVRPSHAPVAAGADMSTAGPQTPAPAGGVDDRAAKDRAGRIRTGTQSGDNLSAPVTPTGAGAAGGRTSKLSAANGAAGGATPGAGANQGVAPSTPATLTGACTPMVVVGGAQAKKAAADQAAEGEEERTSGGKTPGAKGSLLPSTLISELQRDAAFLEAVDKNDLEVVKCLLEAGADVHSRQDKAILLALGAIDNNNPDKWMPRPRDRAPALSICRAMVDLLLKHGADINARQGRAICQAARWNDTYSIDYLVALGGDRSWMDKDPQLQQMKSKQ